MSLTTSLSATSAGQKPSMLPNTSSTTKKSTIIDVANAGLYLIKLLFSSSWSGLNYLGSGLISGVVKWVSKPLTEAEMKTLHAKQCVNIADQFKLTRLGHTTVTLEPKQTTFLYRPRIGGASRLDLRQLNKVISIDKENKIAHVQGLITLDNLFEELLKFGLMPTLVTELRGITLGGAISGLAVESTSFKRGLFHQSVLEMEILMASGEIVTCSPTKNSDLFYGIPNSYGTLGYILSAKIQVFEAKPFVDVEYKHFNDLQEFFNVLENCCQQQERYDFIDGAVFSDKHMVLVLGKSVDKASYKTTDYIKDAVYYKEIQKTEKATDSFPIRDYIWRWDRDYFWATGNSFLQNPLFRKVFGTYALRSDRLSLFRRFMREFQANVITPFQTTKVKKEELIQDVGVPIKQCATFCNWFKANIGIYPLFICPVKPETLPTPLWKLNANDYYCDVGFYDRVISDKEEGHYNKLVEQKLIEIGGIKSLFSKCFFSEDQFNEIYPSLELKQEFDPQGIFPTLYQKVVKGH